LASKTALPLVAIDPSHEFYVPLLSHLPDDFDRGGAAGRHLLPNRLAERQKTVDGFPPSFLCRDLFEHFQRLGVHGPSFALGTSLQRVVDLRRHVPDVQRRHSTHASTLLASRSSSRSRSRSISSDASSLLAGQRSSVSASSSRAIA